MRAQQKIAIALRLEGAHHCRADESPMTGHEDPGLRGDPARRYSWWLYTL